MIGVAPSATAAVAGDDGGQRNGAAQSEDAAVPSGGAERQETKKTPQKPSQLPGQENCERFYNSMLVQVGVAVLIGANFFTNIVEKQIDPRGDKHDEIFKAMEL